MSIVKMAIPPNLQIQCNPYQITNGIFFTELEQKNFFQLYENKKDAKEPKQYWERKTELEESGSLASDYTTKL